MDSPAETFVVRMRAFLPLFLLFAGCNAPVWGANALLHPSRRASRGIPDGTHSFEADAGDGIVLKGWWARGQIPRRGLVVWLHGVGDNKDSAEDLVERWTKKGFDVAAYDARAHGSSGGKDCTYGFYEKADLRRVLDALEKEGADVGRTTLIGFSMGAAVALQAAPLEPRVRAVAALAPFANLREAATRAAPFWMSKASIAAAFSRAQELGRFSVDAVSPVQAAARIQIPLLLVHGTRDHKLPPADSQAILQAAPARDKKLVLVDGADHDNLLDRKETWAALDQFLDRVSPPAAR
jgi:alpha-beta hydrolase superfamily lysophospholipase